MLDVLAGADSSGGSSADAAAPVKAIEDSKAAPAAVDAGKATPAASAAKSSFLDGRELQEEYYGGSVWAVQQPLVEAACTAAPGTKPYTFPSVHARSVFFQVWGGRAAAGVAVRRRCSRCDSCDALLCAAQLYTLVVRTFVGYWRNNSYNWMRWVTFIGLMTLFGACCAEEEGGAHCGPTLASPCPGTIYYKITSKTSDFAGMQSLVSVIFMGGLFVAILVMVGSRIRSRGSMVPPIMIAAFSPLADARAPEPVQGASRLL